MIDEVTEEFNNEMPKFKINNEKPKFKKASDGGGLKAKGMKGSSG